MKYFLVIIMVLSTSLIISQEKAKPKGNLSIGIESNLQYNLFDELENKLTEDNFRSNNYANISYAISNYTFGIQLEGYAPKAILNFSPSYDKQIGLATVFAKYRNKKTEITLGHFYEQFGSGLTLRSWEDRQLGINNALLGGRIKYNATNDIELTGLIARQRYGFKLSESNIYGINSEINLGNILNYKKTALSFGLSYVGKDEPYEGNPGFKASDFPNYVYTTSARIDFTKGGFYSNAAYVFKSDDVRINTGLVHEGIKFDGNAILLTFGYSKKGLGVSATLRRLENMLFYSERRAAGNEFNEQIMNYIPGLTKQHDYSLSNIYSFTAQPGTDFTTYLSTNNDNAEGHVNDGELGGQIDFYYKIKKGSLLGGKYGTKIAANFSQWTDLYTTITKTEESEYDTEYNTDFLYYRTLLFRDANIEIRKKWSKKVQSIFTYMNIFYNKDRLEGKGEGEVLANIIIAESTIKLGKGKSIRVEAQHLSTNDDKKNWMAGTVEANFSTKLSFFATDMYNYGTTKKHYYNFGTSYTKGKSRVSLSYGKQREGILCVGGVCRQVQAATGFNMSVITSF